MMKRLHRMLITLVLAVIAPLLTGCLDDVLTSIQTDANTVYNGELLGKWSVTISGGQKRINGGDSAPWIVGKGKDHDYILTAPDMGGKTIQMRLVKIGENTFVEIGEAGDTAAHSLARITIHDDGNTVRLWGFSAIKETVFTKDWPVKDFDTTDAEGKKTAKSYKLPKKEAYEKMLRDHGTEMDALENEFKRIEPKA